VLNVGNELFANMDVGVGDAVMNTQPFYHIGGSCGALPTPLTLGCRMVIPEYYEAERVMQLIERERCVARTGFAAMYIMEMSHPRFRAYDVSSVRSGWCSGTREMLEKVRAAMGIPYLMLTYSSTEVGGTASRWTDSWEQRSTTAGRPLVGTEHERVDPETGAAMPPREPGAILMRGWRQMNAYLNQPEQTAKTIDAEGWVHTGDRGFIDRGGCLHFVGRYKDMLKVGGENVSAEEVEGMLLTHPAVKQAAVIGAPDPRLDEVPMAIVELAEGAAASADEIIAYCASRMAGFRVPRHVRFVREWPLTGSGKIQKPKLREVYLAEFRA
jgi:fatty-acyl-CoA synthase/long-chain acyl-CoA synthetase